MPIINFTPSQTTGLVGVQPCRAHLNCTDTYAQITEANYLSISQVQPTDFVDANYGSDGASFGTFVPSISNNIVTLAPYIGEGNVATPTVADHIMVSTNTTGKIGNKTGTAINDGSIQFGRSGVAGSGVSFPSTASKGSLALTAVANTGDTITTISNAVMGQASTVSIPDPGASTANFLLDAGAANIVTDYQQFVGLTNILINSVGTWTRTRIAEANYSLVHTPADDTSIIGIDILPQLRAAASKGFKLASIDVIYTIATLALDAHTFTLDSVSYANNAAVTVTSAGSGSLSTATQANPYVTNVQPITPAFLNTACSKYVFELTVNAAATSVYSFYGLNLHFSKTIS